jgi:pheromone shutdown protein TraB
MKYIRQFMHITITFFKAIVRLIIGLKTPKGLLALFLALLLYYGWAIAFIVYGTILKDPWFISIGTSVVVFWMAPLTPFWALTIFTTLFIQRVILRDKKTQSFRKIYNMYLGESKHKSDDRLIALVEDKTDFADPTKEEIEASKKQD